MISFYLPPALPAVDIVISDSIKRVLAVNALVGVGVRLQTLRRHFGRRKQRPGIQPEHAGPLAQRFSERSFICIFHAFSPVSVMPFMKLFCAKRKMIMMGMTITVAAAISICHSWPC